MFTIAVIGQKGGTGKTTVALGLSAVAAQLGQSVALLDLDPQTSAASWRDRRKAESVAVLPTPIGRLRPAHAAALAHGADLVVIDTPGRYDDVAFAACQISDLVIVPIAAQVFELETLAAMRDLIQRSGATRSFILLNNVHPSATASAEAAKALAARASSLAVCPMHLCVRDAYATAPATGQAPNETEPDGKAAGELHALYKFICEQVSL